MRNILIFPGRTSRFYKPICFSGEKDGGGHYECSKKQAYDKGEKKKGGKGDGLPADTKLTKIVSVCASRRRPVGSGSSDIR